MDAATFLKTANSQKKYFESGATHSADFRIEKLKRLKESIRRHEKDIFDALYTDMKKPQFEAYASEIGFLYDEINFAIRHLRSWMKPKRVGTPILHFPSSSYIYTEPFGVVLIISPWNYPVQLIFAPLLAAMAAGNCAIVKPSELAPASARVVEMIIKECFAEEYVSVVQGNGAEVVPMMMEQFRFNYILYTGGMAVGKKIAAEAAKDLIPVMLELGGKSPCIVDEGCDLTVAVKRIVWGKFFNAGQTCVAPDYVLVHSALKNDFMAVLVKTLQETFGDEPSSDLDFSRIINERHFKRLIELLVDGRIVYGGKSNAEKLFIQPTVMEISDLNHSLMKQEIFGPILPVLEFSKLDEAITMIKQNPYPLSLYLFTNNERHKKRIIEEIQFGGGSINNTLVQFANPNLPIGGIGFSGNGRYHGKYGFDIFSYKKSITQTRTWLDISIKYQPYKDKLKWLRLFLKP